jgi:ribosomal protein S18 acetylase RimI-like enzyme
MIRRYGDEDAEQVRRCIIELQEYERALESDRVEGRLIAARHLEQMLTTCARKRGQLFVAEVEQAVVGFVCVWMERETEVYLTRLTAYAYISDLAVLPEFRRLGLGKALLRTAEAFARKQGAAALSLNVLARNAMARAAYAAAGFREYELALIKDVREP